MRIALSVGEFENMSLGSDSGTTACNGLWLEDAECQRRIDNANKNMKIHSFTDADLRILGTLAIDLYVDKLYWEVVRFSNIEDNYWSIDVKFAIDKERLDTEYDSLHIDCGKDNEPATYQMSWCRQDKDGFRQRPITSPLIVVHQFEEMCKKSAVQMN